MTTRSLRETQHLLAKALRSATPLDESEHKDVLLRLIGDSARLSAIEQADIYREMFLTRHIDCLADDFPALLWLLGPEDFERVAIAYLMAHPPSSFSLNELGASLPRFLAQRSRSSVPSTLAVDLARFEWAIAEAHDAAQLPSFDPHALEGYTDEHFDAALVTLSPSLRVLTLRYDVLAIYEPLLDRAACLIPRPLATCVVVTRSDAGQVEWLHVDLHEGAALAWLQQGLSLSDAFDKVAATLDAPALERMAASVGAWFSSWLTRGWVREVRFS